MLDQMISHVFVIRVEYFIKNDDGKKTSKSMIFTSNYPAEDAFFQTYIKQRMKNEKNFLALAEGPFKQTLVPLTNFCR